MLGGLEAKEADFAMCPIDMERFSPETETPVDYGPPAYHSDFFMASIPLSEKIEVRPTVMDIFLCLSPDACALVFLSLAIFWGLFKHFSKVENVWLRLYSCALNQDSFETHRSSTKWLTLLYVMAVFWFMQYWTSFISTDMTVSAPEKVIDSLNDLYQVHKKRQPKVYPVLLEGLNIESMILDSKESSAHAIHDIIKKEPAKCVYPMVESSMISIMDRIYEGTAAFIMDKAFWKGSQFLACNTKTIERAHTLRRSQSTIHPSAPYHVYAKGINPELRITLDDMNYRLFESGLHQDQHEVRATYDTPFFDMASPTARLCLFTFDEQKEITAEEVMPFGLEYVVFAFYLFCGGTILAGIFFFLLEPIHARMDKKTGKRERKVTRGGAITWLQVQQVSLSLNQNVKKS